MIMRAISIEVYSNRKYRGCANGGISEKYDELLLVHDRGNIEIDENNLPENLVKVVVRNMFGKEVRHIEPYNRPDRGNVGWMAGGSYAASCDSRFREVAGHYGALSIHDRQESQQMYDELSR